MSRLAPANVRYHVWCLSREDEEEYGSDVIAFDTATVSPWPRDTKHEIYIPFYRLGSAKEAAEHYADYFHSNRDGWESSWPLTFRVRLPDGTTEDYEVERETVPQFHASKVRAR